MSEESGIQESSENKRDREKKKFYDQLIFRAWCKSCGICIAFCPKNVLGKNEAGEPVIERPDDCIGCRFCEIHCPDFAITVIERGTEAGAAENG
ncbi:MAG: 2-ketoglutarate oxidoreductase subunit delta [Deltaproteobacteria bacterium]|nr:MAG: 2-ketoglutarate oxidoreductase subunit delta [Deltaproteobacteria bacterium]